MELISVYFKKYQNIGLETKMVKRTIAEVLKEICKVEIESRQIQIGADNIKILVTGPAKSQILINKTKIQKAFIEKIEGLGFKNKGKKII